jgi:hypothetical protein
VGVRIPFDEFLLSSEVANERGISENRLFEGEAIAQRKLDPGISNKTVDVVCLKRVCASCRRLDPTASGRES